MEACELQIGRQYGGENDGEVVRIDARDSQGKRIGLDGSPFCKQFKRESEAYRCPLTLDLFR